MDTDALLSIINAELKALGSPLADAKDPSVIGVLNSAIAAAQSEANTFAENLTAQSTPSLATGVNLDNLVTDVELQRQTGSQALGRVLASNSQIQILPAFSLLRSVDSSIVLETTEAVTLTPNEQIIPVRSIQRAAVNYPAGTRLISESIPTALFEIGNFRNATGQALGSLRGGLSPESDEDLRERYFELFRSLAPNRIGLTQSLENILEVQDYIISQADPIPGWLTLYINTDNAATIEQIEGILTDFSPGLAFQIRSFLFTPLTIQAELTLLSTANIAEVEQGAREVLDMTLREAGLGATITQAELTASLYQVPGIRRASVTEPVVSNTAAPGNLFQLGTFSPTFRR